MENRNFLVHVILGAMLMCFPLAKTVQSQNSPQYYLKHAETYYWLGIQDHGDPKAFEIALDYLVLAEKALSENPPLDDPREYQSLKSQIQLLRTDIQEQYIIARDTYIGVFPMARFMGRSIFVQSDAYGSYELFEDPAEVAAGNTAQKLGDLFYQHFYGDLQVPVFIFSDNMQHPDMESKARVTLKKSSRVKVYQTQYLKKLLSDEELEMLQKMEPSPALIEKLCNKFRADNFALVNISRKDEVNGVHFFSFATHIYAKDSESPIQTITLYELIRDKRDTRQLYILTFLSLFLISVLLYILQYRYYHEKLPGITKVMAGPVMGFWVGLLSTIIALGIFSNTMPSFLDYFGYTFWWIPVAFIVITFAPLLAIRAYVLRLSYYQETMEASSRLAPLFASSALGATAYLSLGFLLYYSTTGFIYITATALVLATIAFVIGKSFGSVKPFPVRFAFVGALLLPFAGMAVSTYSNAYLVIPILGSAAIIVSSRISMRKKKKELADQGQKKKTGNVGIADFLLLTEYPPYRKPSGFDEIMLSAKPFTRGEVTILCLTGNEGCGKTATAHQMLQVMEEQLSTCKKPLLTLNVQCEENQTTPYYPIQQALFEYVYIGGKDSDDESIGEIEDVLDGLLGNFIPFAGFITPGKKEKKPAFNTQTELFISIYKTLTELSKKHSVIFFVDDLQWADNASLELLKFLHERFTEKTGYNIMFLYTSRPSLNIDNLFVSQQIITLTPLTFNERLQLLTLDMGLERESAGFILHWTGEQNRGKGGMFWMYKILEQLARNGHLQESKQGLKLSDTVLKSQTLPIPEDYRKTLRMELNKLQDNKKYLAVAACMGLEFEVSILAAALDVDRLKCLEALQYMEKETNLIIDRPEKDDIFAFTSSFTLECIRQELELSSEGPRGAVKQIVREYHARLAAMIEKQMPEGNTLRIARHYYAAGKKYASNAIGFLISAARQCAEVFRFDEARDYLEKVVEESAFVDNPQQYDLDMLLVECRISALEGKGFATVARKCVAFVDQNPDTKPECLIVFAQIQYYAHQFQQAILYCEAAIKNTSDPHLLAEAHHLMGISIDFKNAGERLSHIQKAMEYIESIKEKSTQVLRTLSSIHNSLGEEYSKKSHEDNKLKATAQSHFEKSIELKSLKEINDTPGLARSYGGLGRLEMTIEPVKIDKALEYFQKDLELARQTGDVLGQIIMYSSMGNCYLLNHDTGKAKDAYEKSLALSERASDKAFALLGLIRIYDNEPDAEWGEEAIRNLSHILNQEDFVPQFFLKKELITFFQNARKQVKYEKMLERLSV